MEFARGFLKPEETTQAWAPAACYRLLRERECVASLAPMFTADQEPRSNWYGFRHTQIRANVKCLTDDDKLPSVEASHV